MRKHGHRQRWIALGMVVWLAGPGAAQTRFADVTQVIRVPLPAAKGIAAGDYDNDGWPDLLIAARSSTLLLLGNDGRGGFDERPGGLDLPGPNGSGPLFGDIDNDGDLDLFVPKGSFGGTGVDRLLRSDRGVFTDITLRAGLGDTLPTDNAIWLDVDRDGHLDLYVGHWLFSQQQPELHNDLFQGLGGGAFVAATAAVGLDVDLHPGDSHQGGGSAQGMAAGDFDDDGWPDLYLGVFDSPNRLFFNDGEGGFVDRTTAEIADPGQAFGVAVGDVDNDGDLDIFQAAGGAGEGSRSRLLLNLGGGSFLEATQGSGLGASVGENWRSARLFDVDNDGDLDLLSGSLRTNPLRTQALLFANDSRGIFTDVTATAGLSAGGNKALVLDFDLDGFLDVVIIFAGSADLEKPLLYRNSGNGNHWLRLDLVGVRSNRDAIGARVVATAGDLRQTRDLLGGTGFLQDEMVVHFGLGGRDRVDTLQIHWPSGQIDVLTDIPARQKIRVVEGQSRYLAIVPSAMEVTGLPDTVAAGTTHDLSLLVRPALFDAGAQVTNGVADLSAWGGAADTPLADRGDGTYGLNAVARAPGTKGRYELGVMVDQATSVGSRWLRLTRNVAVVPPSDLVIYADELASGWTASGTAPGIDPASTAVAAAGSRAIRIEGEAKSGGVWRVQLLSASGVEPFGYSHLRLSLRPEGVSAAPVLLLTIGGRSLDLTALVDLDRAEWQRVDVPLEGLFVPKAISQVSLSGNFAGALYLDDLRLLTVAPRRATAVAESGDAAVPKGLALDVNYPNPFNPETRISFHLPAADQVELAVYNLAAQRVSTLVQGWRDRGSYTVRWDGRDDTGRSLATGVYLYRLESAGLTLTRKLLLLR